MKRYIKDIKIDKIAEMSKQELCETFASEEVTHEQLEEIKKHDYVLRTEKHDYDEEIEVVVIGGGNFSVKVD